MTPPLFWQVFATVALLLLAMQLERVVRAVHTLAHNVDELCLATMKTALEQRVEAASTLSKRLSDRARDNELPENEDEHVPTPELARDLRNDSNARKALKPKE